MYNLIIVSSKPSEWTHEEFIQWWRGPHADATLKIPGLRSWRQIEIDRAFDKRSQDWDGVSMLSFDSSEAADRAFASEEWKEAVEQVGDMGGRRLAFLGEEIVRIPDNAAQQVGL